MWLWKFKISTNSFSNLDLCYFLSIVNKSIKSFCTVLWRCNLHFGNRHIITVAASITAYTSCRSLTGSASITAHTSCRSLTGSIQKDGFTDKNKSIRVKCHNIRDLESRHKLRPVWINTLDNAADLLTKPLSSARTLDHCKAMFRVWSGFEGAHGQEYSVKSPKKNWNIRRIDRGKLKRTSSVEKEKNAERFCRIYSKYYR